jgi:NAD(P)-dependent dehydrogenase (short-subunit alcohol dehydrogenase family)
MKFENKVIVICGAGKGIGFNLAKSLDDLGCRLILHAFSNESMEKLKCSFSNKKHKYFKCDFSDPLNLEFEWNKQIGVDLKVDGFVNCVGTRLRRPLNLLNASLIIQIMTTNFVSHLEMIRILTKKGNYNSGFSAVGVSSIAAHIGSAGVAAYAASKAAMEAATRCLAKELFKKKIRVNTVVCGQINTEAYDSFMETKTDADNILDRQFLGLGTSQDVSDIILFLLSDKSRFISGASIPADGGYLI